MSLDAMRATNRIFEEEVVGRGDFAALDRVYTEDARILPPGAPMISGRAAIRDFWKATAGALQVKALRLVTVEAKPAGDVIVEIGRAEVDTAAGPNALALKYVVIWRQEAGTWRSHIDIWNASA
jgi:ketosteroid isomerase-like protein